MHFKIIGCNVLRREIYLCAARSPHVVDVVMLPQGLHDQPDLLRSSLQREMDAPPFTHPRSRQELFQAKVEAERPYDAILLGYALCSNGTAGLTARNCPVVIPRAHDCITLLLGSHTRYQEYFDRFPGTYWFSSGWMETCIMPGKERYEQTLACYREKYGEENAQYLMEVEADWYRKYRRAAYIDWQFPNNKTEKARVRESADYLKWDYDEVKGDDGLLQRMLNGIWQPEEFLILQPGQTSEADPAGPDILKLKA